MFFASDTHILFYRLQYINIVQPRGSVEVLSILRGTRNVLSVLGLAVGSLGAS